MQNNRKNFLSRLFLVVIACGMFSFTAFSEEINDATDESVVDETMEALSADAVSQYQVEGSLFQQITDLEQEKVLMQLEKERAQLNLELDKLAAEKIKLHMEIDTLSGRAEQQQKELENAQAKLEAETAKLEREKEEFEAQAEAARNAQPETVSTASYYSSDEVQEPEYNFSKNYRLINVFGAGNQLQATIKNLNSGQEKRVSVGKVVDGYTVKSISLDDGIVFEKDGETQTLSVVSGLNE